MEILRKDSDPPETDKKIVLEKKQSFISINSITLKTRCSQFSESHQYFHALVWGNLGQKLSIALGIHHMDRVASYNNSYFLKGNEVLIRQILLDKSLCN